MAIVSLAAGCAINAALVRPDEALDGTGSYVYGRFVIKAMPSTMGEKGRPAAQTVGLLLACDDGSTYPLYFSAEREVRVVKIRPARCSVHEIRYVSDWNIVRGSKAPPAAWIHLDRFAAGQGYYLGDFAAVAKIEIVPGGELLSWDVDAVDDQFTETTAELRRKFAALGALPLRDQRLSPPRVALQRGLAAADEPAMSPERISRLAGFVKNTFPSPMACTAACRTGDCLPYRGPSGPAMTCISHCMTSRDCPTGMVCNCADRPGTDCQFVATAPGDSMEGICMPAASQGLK